MHNKIEVLSPAGSYESVVAAIANNADAVYIGAKNFSARQNALNFDYDELKQTVEYCHIRGAKVYQAINIIVFDEEIDELLECIKTACEVGIDALIVQDFGVLDIIKKVAPAMPVHISTQMSVHTPHGAALAKKLGAKRIVLARELNFEQIKNIVKSVDIETEVFVHGALCMSVSGQCYMSGMIGGRSGNRGCCAGTCRMPFTSTSDEGHVLSLKDLCLTQYVTLLEEIGVTSLKIEGRMKRPEYVASATKAYDEARKGNTPDTETLKAVFSRSGFTQGYFLDKPGSDMFGIRQKDDVLAATPKVLKELSNTYKKETSRVLISFAINIKKDVPILLSVTDEDNNTLSVSGECPQIALNKAIDEEYVIKSLSKLGSTPFYTNEIVCNIEDGLMVSAGELNALRRQACTQLETMRISKKPKVDFRLCNPYDNVKRQSSVSKIYARFLSLDQVSRLALLECDAIILPINAAKKIGSLAIEKSKIILEPPRVMFGNEKEVVEELTLLKE
ncbi:MAG: U32 family peptidase, partial [Oscillospiraceae bacterium]